MKMSLMRLSLMCEIERKKKQSKIVIIFSMYCGFLVTCHFKSECLILPKWLNSIYLWISELFKVIVRFGIAINHNFIIFYHYIIIYHLEVLAGLIIHMFVNLFILLWIWTLRITICVLGQLDLPHGKLS